MRRIFRILFVIVMGLLPFVAASDITAKPGVEPRAGLMWQNTGLPAVFPLQVKTDAGRNYYLQLLNAETGKPSLAAFIEGGNFFKVLVPPGRFKVLIFAGRRWQGEDLYFGQGALTEVIALADPLTFGTRGLSTKVGHQIDLTKRIPDERADVSVKAQLICQTLGIAPVPPRSVVFGQFHGKGPVLFGRAGQRGRHLWHLKYRGLSATMPGHDKQEFLHIFGPHTSPFWRGRYGPKFRFSVRTRVC